MINVSDNLKNAVLNEEMPKRLEVSVTDVDNLQLLNWYATEYHGSNWYELNIPPNNSYSNLLNLFKFDVEGAINYDYVNQAEWIGVSFDLIIEDVDPDSSNRFYIGLGNLQESGEITITTYSTYSLSYFSIFSSASAIRFITRVTN